jgi:hypothetical protein
LVEHGAFVALALLVIWVVLLIPLARGTLKIGSFAAASLFLALMIPFFWLGPEITELTILKLGSFKTNVEQATKYLDEIKTIRTKIEAEDRAVSAVVASITPRTLGEVEQNTVIVKIRPFAGTGFIAFVEMAPEPIDFLNLLEGVLTAAGWQAHPPPPAMPQLNRPNRVPVGQSLSFSGFRVWFDGTRNPSLKLAAETLNSALSAEGISTVLDADAFTDAIDPAFVVIQIGEKPRS